MKNTYLKVIVADTEEPEQPDAPATITAPEIVTPTPEPTIEANACWVAREVYGVDNPQWMLFREWLLSGRAPAWLVGLYMRRGEKFAAWLRPRSWARKALKPVMSWCAGI